MQIQEKLRWNRMQDSGVGGSLREKGAGALVVYWRAAEGGRMRADEAIHIRPAGGKGAHGAEIKRMREGMMGAAERGRRMG